MFSKKKLTALSIKEKLKLIKEIEEDHIDKKAICLKYKCDISTVNRILKKKVEIYEAACSSANLKQKRNRKGEHDHVERALGIWFEQQRRKKAVISGKVLIRKAKEIAIEFGDDFEPDPNWLYRWKKRQNIKLGEIHGEASDNNKDNAQIYIDSILPGLIKEYSPENILNAAESVLYYKALPAKNDYQQDLQPVGHTSQKVRFTLLFICNATATFKRVYVIGKSKKPRCFKNVVPPVPYFSNAEALMTAALWHEIWLSLDIEMKKLNKKIILFVDKASCHKTPHLTNIVIQFLPPSTTDLIQPLDQGIISDFKSYYREIIVKKQISALERDMTANEFYKSISYLDALHFINRAWWLVTPSCITNCFKKAGFISETPENYLEIKQEVDFPDSTEFIHCDPDVECYGEMAGSQRIDDITNDNLETDKQNEIDSEDEEEVNQIPSLKEALKALNVVQKYCFYKNINISVDQIEEEMINGSIKSAAKQTAITDFFS